MALAAIADDRDLLALDEADVGIPVVINAHFDMSLRYPSSSPEGRGYEIGPTALIGVGEG
jgi:hypothetical protein